MPKILSARDLLELVRQEEGENRVERDAAFTEPAPGRRVYQGNARARPPALARRENQPERTGPKNTQVIEPPRGRVAPVQPPPSQVLRPPQAPTEGPGTGPARQGASPLGSRAGTPGGALPPAERPRSLPVDPTLEREDAKTLELELRPRPQPKVGETTKPLEPVKPPPKTATLPLSPLAKPAPTVTSSPSAVGSVAPGPVVPPKRSLSPAQPLRKADSKWGRPGETPLSQPPPSPQTLPAAGPPKTPLPPKPPENVEPDEPRVDPLPLGRVDPLPLPLGSKPLVGGPLGPNPLASLGPALAHPLGALPLPMPGGPLPGAIGPSVEPTAARVDPMPIPAAPISPPAPPAPKPALVEPPVETPPQSSLASMFSWVTQKPAWAPSVEALDAPATERAEPPAMSAPVAPPMRAPEPPVAPAPVAPAPAAAQEPQELSSEETLVLIHYDAATPMEVVAEATGMSEWRVAKIVDKLKDRGVLESEPPPSGDGDRMDTVLEMQAPPSGAFEEMFPNTQPSNTTSAATPLKPSDVGERTILELEIEYPEPARPDRARTEELAALELIDDDLDPEQTEVDADFDMPVAVDSNRERFPPLAQKSDPGATSAPVTGETPAAAPVSAKPGEEIRAAVAAARSPSEAPQSDERTANEVDEATREAEEEAAAEAAEAPGRMSLKEEEEKAKSWLALFETKLSLLSSDERAKLATTASGDTLYALIYDKDPQVVRALWTNSNIIADHARFAAFHHRTTMGLELIGQRTEFIRDPQIQRRLMRNPMVSETLLRKMLLSKRLIEIYKFTLDRDAGDRARQSARGLLRNKFATTEAEDRLELIWKTEGRALTALSGLSIDSKTAALICARPIVSMMLVQSFCKFASTPPSVISHFLKQPLVKRQIQVKHMLLKHPNCPSDAKRAL